MRLTARLVVTVGVACFVLAGAACSSSSEEKSGGNDGSGGAGGATAATGGSAAGDGPDSGRAEPLSVWEPDLPTEGSFCSFLVAVECDGVEDCPDGQICCGTLNGGSLSYDSIRCQETCDLADGGRTLCHSDGECPGEEDACIRSIILPSYLAICGTPGTFTPEGFDGAGRAAGEINCAPGLACTGGDVCCALTSWQAETQQATFIDGRCAPTAAECSCSGGTAPTPVPGADGGSPLDAGGEAGRPDGSFGPDAAGPDAAGLDAGPDAD